MTQLPPLPDDLKNLLVAAGVRDDASLHAALDADPDLRSAYEAWLFDSVIHAFANTQNREALLDLSEHVPMIATDDFIATVQRAIDAALDMGDYETAEALRQRLEALKEIRAMKAYQRQAPLARAVIAFVQAADDEAAHRAYAAHRDQLNTDEAEKMLVEDFEANDDKARAHLRRRAAMLRALRRADAGAASPANS
jgi:hypothetical protein